MSAPPRHLPVIVLIAVTVVAAASPGNMAGCDDGSLCCTFVHESVRFQEKVARKVKEHNGRRVYLFDAVGFSSDFKEAVTPEHFRYKTGSLHDVEVDVVLSASAQRTLSGRHDASAVYYKWLSPAENASMDDYGVHI